jgi:DNA-binding CsgD family transcriptional regulator
MSEVEKVRELHHSLQSIDNTSAFLRFVVHSLFVEHGALAAYYGVVLDSSQLLIVDSYGYESSAFMKHSLHSIWSETAATDSLRRGQIICFANMGEYLASYPKNAKLNVPGDGFIGVPFWQNGSPVAVLGVALDLTGLEPNEDLVDLAERLRAVIEISMNRAAWLEATTTELEGVSPANFGDFREPALRSISDLVFEAMTERQLEILSGMADGHTNRRIAHELNLSESTVGKESIEIYRKLRVNSRKQAVSVANLLGLLADEIADEVGV